MGSGDDGEGGVRPKGAGAALGDTALASKPDTLSPILRKLAEAPPQRSLKAGDSVGRFELLRELGRGGFGVVYEARDRELGRRVALKMVANPAGVAVEQALAPLLKHEAATAARLNHPNIVTLHDLGMFEGTPYLVLELLEGETVAQRLARGRLAPAEATEIAVEVTRALMHSHRVGVIHRDLKPSNVFLTGEGTVKVLDLGLARLVAAVENIRSTMFPERSLRGAGTPAYMAPEQWRGDAGDERTDVFSLGVTLFEMLAGPGSLPFDVAGRGRAALLDDTPAASLTDVSPALSQLVATALAKDPARRFQSAEQMLDALTAARRGSARLRRRWPLIAVAALAIVAGGGLYFGRASRHPAASASVPSRRSVAVLGFRNLSGRPDAAWISTALGETLTTELGLGDRLRTVPGEKIAHAKNDLSLADADGFELDTLARLRSNLATDYVVLGSYLLQSGGAIRVDVRLQDTQTGDTIATIAENGTEGDLIGLVARVGSRLREKLGAGTISPADTAAVRRALPSNPEAARLYSEGLARARQFDLVAARALLERAASVEPDSPLPPAALADVYEKLGLDVEMRAASKKAFELSSGLSREERLAIEARYRHATGDQDKAIELYKTLCDFYPDNVEYGLDLADVYTHAGRLKDAIAVITRLRRLPPPASDDPRIDFAEGNASNDMKRSIAVAQLATRKAEAMGARLLIARAQQDEAGARLWSGDFDGAIRLSVSARSLFQTAGNQYAAAQSLFPVAVVAVMRDDDMPKVEALFSEQLAIFRKGGMRYWEASKLGDLAFGYLNSGELASARKVIGEADAIAREIHNPWLERRGRVLWGWTRWEEGDLAAARESLETWLANQQDQHGPVSEFAIALARVWTAAGEPARARKLLEQQVERSDKLTQPWEGAAGRAALARALIEEGQLAEAEATARKAVDDLRKLKIVGGLDEPLDALARALIAQNKLDEAKAVLDQLAAMKAYEWNHHDHVDVAILGARLRALHGDPPAEALRMLQAAKRDAARWHLGEPELEARLYEGELELRAGRADAGHAHLAALAREARGRGFLLIARKAAAASR